MSRGQPDWGCRHQPASPEDLRQFPPQTDACRELRQLLRDQADGDLSPEQERQVQEHVHGCGDCDLALSRAELEALRIRRACQEPDLERLGPGEDFVDEVMTRVQAELLESENESEIEAELGRRVEAGAARTPCGFTGRVMARVEAESRRQGILSRRTLRPVPLLASTMCLLLAVWLGLPLLPQYRLRAFSVVVAREASVHTVDTNNTLTSADGWRPLMGEPTVKVGDRLRTGDGGYLRLVRGDLQLELLAGGELRIGREDFRLERGGLELETPEEFGLVLGDDSRVDVSQGRYRIQVLVAQGPGGSPDRLLKVRLQVDSGWARIRRGSLSLVVEPGQVAHYGGASAMRVDVAPGPELWRRSRAGVAARGAVEAGRRLATGSERKGFVGMLLDPQSQQPLAEASVRITTYLGTQTVSTSADGVFPIEAIAALSGQFAVIQALSPDLGLGPLGPVTLRLPREAWDRQPRRFLLDRERRLYGTLRDHDNRHLAGAKVQAFLLDEVFGLVDPLSEALPLDQRGAFDLRGLPRQLAPHQALLLVAWPAQAAGRVMHRLPAAGGPEAGLAAGLDMSLELRLPPTADVELTGLPPSQLLQVLEGVWGLDRVYRLRLLETDASGRLGLPKAAGARRWLLRHAAVPLDLDGGSQAVPALLAGLRAGPGTAQGILVLGQQGRYQELRQLPEDGRRGLISVHEAGSGRARPGTALFLRQRGGVIQFLGIYEGRSPLVFDGSSESGAELWGLAADGAVGRLALDAQAGRVHYSLPVQRPARLALRGVPSLVLLRRQAAAGIGGEDLVLLRPAGTSGLEAGWLPPGEYELELPDGKRQVLQLAPGDQREIDLSVGASAEGREGREGR